MIAPKSLPMDINPKELTPFTPKESGLDLWHFNGKDDHSEGGDLKRLIIAAPASDKPSPLRYKTFFYNSCSSGPGYIENFQHGDFIYTNVTCWVTLATRDFVKRTIEGWDTPNIVSEMNLNKLGGLDSGEVYSIRTAW